MGIFTGLVMETGRVRCVDRAESGVQIAVAARKVLDGTRVGDSIAINGVDLTATRVDPEFFTADVSIETLNRSTLGSLRTGSRVNLERALAAAERLGGHIVQGHIDDTGALISICTEGSSFRLRFAIPHGLMPYIAMKGAIAIDGISLTIAGMGENWIEVVVIPYTWRETTLSELDGGNRVNIEVDVLAKYVERILSRDCSGGNAEP